MPRNKLTIDQENEIVKRYTGGIETVRVIARSYPQVHFQTVHNILERRGIPIRAAHARVPRIADDRRAEIVAACVEGGLTSVAAAEKFGVSQESVLKFAGLAGVRLPKGTPRSCSVNESVFANHTPASLYWRGFLHADGCVHQDAYGSPVLVCGLGEKDIGHLTKLRDFLQSTHAIAVHPPGRQSLGGPTAYYRVRSRQICEALRAGGLVTHRPLPPAPDLAQSTDYWRGSVDGDGWLGVQEGYGYASVFVGFCGQYPTVEAYRDFLRTWGIETSIGDTESGIYKVQVTGTNAEKIIKLLYSNATVALDRKQFRADAIIAGDIRKFPPYEEGPGRKVIDKMTLDNLLIEDE